MTQGSSVRSVMPRSFPVVLLCGSLLATGCDRSPRKVHVFGRVNYAGQPIAHGEISLNPLDGTPGPQTGGAIRDGQYDLPRPTGPRAGGTYRIEINGFESTGRKIENPFNPSVKSIEVMKNFVPPEYNARSGLTLRIPNDVERWEHNFELPTPVRATSNAEQ